MYCGKVNYFFTYDKIGIDAAKSGKYNIISQTKGDEKMFSSPLDTLTQEQELIIRRNVDSRYFDVDKIIEYLKTHETVGFDIFIKCCKKKVSYSFLKCFKPISRVSFINRLEIYFYDIKDNENASDMTRYFAEYVSHAYFNDEEPEYFDEPIFKEEYDLEPAYALLDKVITKYEIPLTKVFGYLKNYFGDSIDFRKFNQWVNYLELLEEPNEENVFPKNFYYAINTELVRKGQNPRLVLASTESGKPTFDKESKSQYFSITGYFPKDNDGKLIMDWIGVWYENIEEITIEDDPTLVEDEDFFFFHNFSGEGIIKVRFKVNQDTRIFLLRRIKESDGLYHNVWKQVFAGSKVTKFTFGPVMQAREQLKLSQKEVADLADINLRSYQRMEAGESTPDALALINLMTSLEMTNPNVFRKRVRITDDDYSKFRSKKAPSEFLDEKDNERKE